MGLGVDMDVVQTASRYRGEEEGKSGGLLLLGLVLGRYLVLVVLLLCCTALHCTDLTALHCLVLSTLLVTTAPTRYSTPLPVPKEHTDYTALQTHRRPRTAIGGRCPRLGILRRLQ